MDEKNSSKQTSQGAVACGFENLKITVLEITYRPISEMTKTFTWHSVLVKLLKRLVTRQKKKTDYPAKNRKWINHKQQPTYVTDICVLNICKF